VSLQEEEQEEEEEKECDKGSEGKEEERYLSR